MAYQTLRGFYDILPGETKKWQKMEYPKTPYKKN